MEDQEVVTIVEYFKMSQLDDIALLHHNLNGLAKGTILTSYNGKRRWEIAARILSYHTMDIHKRFQNETISSMHLRFVSLEKREESILKTKEDESNNVYQYYLKAIDHTEKPSKGETLLLAND